MLKSIKNPKVAVSFVCGIILFAILVMMFVPYWSYKGLDDNGEYVDKTTSINGYVWFPLEHKELKNDVFNGDVSAADPYQEPVDANDLALPIGFQILFGAFGVVLCFLKPKNTLVSLLVIACGLFGIYGYAFVGALRMGAAYVWIINLVLSVLAVAAGTLKLVFAFKYKEMVESLYQG